MATQQDTSTERRQAILAATLTAVAERGLHKTTISEIQRRSAASVGSIYHHFGDREGVLYALYIDIFTDCFAQLRASLQQATTARDGIRGLVCTYLTWVEAHPEQAAFIYEASQGDLLRSYRDAILQFKGTFYQEVMAWMRPYLQTGELIILPPWAYDAILLGPAHEFARRWLGGLQELTMAEAQIIIADAVWRAIQPG
ncbi:MAG: TetR/AcrR family transcriptional regulator [Chloroflexota bacterium]